MPDVLSKQQFLHLTAIVFLKLFHDHALIDGVQLTRLSPEQEIAFVAIMLPELRSGRRSALFSTISKQSSAREPPGLHLKVVCQGDMQVASDYTGTAP